MFLNFFANLCQARAKLELREEATERDAMDVVELMRWSMIDTFIDEFGALDFHRSSHGSGMSSKNQVTTPFLFLWYYLIVKTTRRSTLWRLWNICSLCLEKVIFPFYLFFVCLKIQRRVSICAIDLRFTIIMTWFCHKFYFFMIFTHSSLVSSCFNLIFN